MPENNDSTRNDAPPGVLEMDHVFEALDHPHRRYLLYSLRTDGKQPLWELARQITAWDGDVPEEAVSEDRVEHVYVSLYHTHVPKLVAYGIITFSEGEETVERASNAEKVLAVLDKIGGYEDSTQEDHAREEHGEGYS